MTDLSAEREKAREQRTRLVLALTDVQAARDRLERELSAVERSSRAALSAQSHISGAIPLRLER